MFDRALILVFSLTVATADRTKFFENVHPLLNTKDLPAKCSQALDDMGTDALITMLDASGKIPSGIQYGNIYDLGNFDECYNLEAPNPKSSGADKLYGKYCLGYVTLSTGSNGLNTLNISTNGLKWIPGPGKALRDTAKEYNIYLQIGVCIPDQCGAADLSNPIYLSETLCSSKATTPLSLDTNAVVGVSILSIFGLLVIISTIFDIFLYYKQHKTPHDLLIAFSLLSNGRKLLSTSTNGDQLLCLNGIKAISMMWVVLGHMYSLTLSLPLTNPMYIQQEWLNDVANMFLLSAPLSVDTFFAVGGLVAVYTFMKVMDKAPLKKFNIPQFYLHRYLRLTPGVAAITLITATLAKYMGKGPMWNIVDLEFGGPCRDYWWSTLLYIQNYVNVDRQCLSQSWYLNVDMQMFILLPLILVPLKLWPKLTVILLYVLSVIGVIVPFALAYILKLPTFGLITPMETGDWLNHYYMQTYARFGPYVIGMIFGYYIYKLKASEQKTKLHWVLVSVLWAVIIAGLLACLYASHDLISRPDDRWGNSLYLAFHRSAWAVALGGLIYFCVAGYGGPINGLLSAPIFQFISKISYSVFLVHIIVILNVNFSRKTLIKFSNIQMMMDFWGIFMVSVACATVLCLVFESPVIIIEKCIFGRGAKKPKPKVDENLAEEGQG